MDRTHIELWEDCLNIFKDNLPAEQYNAWFAPITPVSYADGKVVLHVPSSYFVEQIESRFNKILYVTLRRIYGDAVKLFYTFEQVGNDPTTNVSIESSRQSPAVQPRQGISPANPFHTKVVENFDSQLNPKYTFENYCGSLSNKIAKSIGEAIASNPNCKTFNPLFIFGPSGVGKTHLIQAIGIRIKENNPQCRVLYLSARLFESQYTAAVAGGRVNDFINFYQSIDVLIIDDIQDLIRKEKTQQAFFHIFNHLHQNQRQIILSSDCCPSKMEGMYDRLLSRFKWGMTAELERPDYNLRRDVLSQKASQDGLDIPVEVIEYIANNVTDSIRELEGIVVSLMAHATVLGREITLELAQTVLANAIKVQRKTINFELITQEVSSYYDIDPDLIFSKSRKREISDARQMVMYMAKRHARMPLTAIGTRLSRTHATVLHACKNIEERLELEANLRDDVSKLDAAILH